MWFRFGPGNNLAMESNAAKTQIRARKVFEYQGFARDRWIDGLALDYNLDWCMILKDSTGTQENYILNESLADSGFDDDLVKIHEPDQQYSLIQRLPGDLWLLANRNGRKADTKNGSIFDQYGKCLGRLSLGDGIQDLQVTESGAIWVGYFDEGVYGGDPLSHSGFVCLREDGSKTFDFLSLALDQKLEPISDCYAFNAISDDNVWMYYYTGNVLVNIQDGNVVTQLGGLPALYKFAISADALLIADLKIQRLKRIDLQSKQIEVLEPVDENNKPIKFVEVCARKNRFCLSDDTFLYYIDLK